MARINVQKPETLMCSFKLTVMCLDHDISLVVWKSKALVFLAQNEMTTSDTHSFYWYLNSTHLWFCVIGLDYVC